MNRQNAVEVIFDHYDAPRRKQRLDEPTLSYAHRNSGCHDRVTIDVIVEHGRIVDAGWDGSGCTISMAAASIVLDAIVGEPATDAVDAATAALVHELGADAIRSRPQCANLAVEAVRLALEHLNANTEH